MAYWKRRIWQGITRSCSFGRQSWVFFFWVVIINFFYSKWFILIRIDEKLIETIKKLRADELENKKKEEELQKVEKVETTTNNELEVVDLEKSLGSNKRLVKRPSFKEVSDDIVKHIHSYPALANSTTKLTNESEMNGKLAHDNTSLNKRAGHTRHAKRNMTEVENI